MHRDDELEELWDRIHRLEARNRYVQYQRDLLEEALETICAAFLNNSKNLDTAIQNAMMLQERARRQPPPDLNIKPR
jgi:hypothetical protein